MKSIFYIVLFIFFASSAWSQKLNELNSKEKISKIVIIDQLKTYSMILVWYDKFYDEHSIKPCGTAHLKQHGKTRILNTEGPRMLVLPVGNQIPFLLLPQDSIEFYSDKATSYPGFAGMPTLKHKYDSIRTNEIKFFETVFSNLGACYGQNSYSTPRQIKSVKDAVNYHLSRYQSRKEFLENYKENNRVSDEFYKYAGNYFHLKLYDDILSSLGSRKFPDSLTRLSAFKIADSLATFLNRDDGTLYYSWYNALQNYVELRIGQGEINAVKFDEVLYQIADNLHDNARDFAVFYLFKFLLNKMPELVKGKLSLLNKYCTDKDYINYISGHTVFIKRGKRDKVLDNLRSYDGGLKKQSTIINDFKGKVIYMDFWASWCLPCLEEMPFSKNLVDEFNGQEVVFLFFSTDKYTEQWKRSIRENNMTDKGIHYQIVDGEKNYFVQKYNISAIPRYILLNKKGEVVDADAPRPSEEKTRELINQLLKE